MRTNSEIMDIAMIGTIPNPVPENEREKKLLKVICQFSCLFNSPEEPGDPPILI